MNFLLKILFASFVLGFLTFTPNECAGQILRLTGGDVRLTVSAPLAAGLDPRPDTDSGSRLMWLFPPIQQSKIVVRTIAPGQDFQLFVEAVSVSGALAQPEVELINGAPAMDLLRNVSSYTFIVGRATLSYRAEAPASRGNSIARGNDQHTVVYTWVSQ